MLLRRSHLMAELASDCRVTDPFVLTEHGMGSILLKIGQPCLAEYTFLPN